MKRGEGREEAEEKNTNKVIINLITPGVTISQSAKLQLGPLGCTQEPNGTYFQSIYNFDAITLQDSAQLEFRPAYSDNTDGSATTPYLQVTTLSIGAGCVVHSDFWVLFILFLFFVLFNIIYFFAGI